jgi:hypothetical protein
MRYSSDQHLAMAKLLRKNGAKRTGAERARFINMSNSFVVCACLSAKDSGGILLDGFEWSSLCPNWDLIEEELELLLPEITGPPLGPSRAQI